MSTTPQISTAGPSTWARPESGAAARQFAEFLVEQRDWTARYGSERLKACLARGYNADKLYCEERIAHELAGYHVYFGFAGPPEVMVKENPTMSALALETQVAATLADHNVRHPLAIRIVRPAESWHGLEAVMVDNWLSRYRLLVRPSDTATATPEPTLALCDSADDIPF